MSVPETNNNQLSFVNKKDEYTRLAANKCGSLWFTWFMMGPKSHMGNAWKSEMQPYIRSIYLPIYLAHTYR